ncbi:MAG: patatin-like phospholipase family protein [Trueperaceae bacterium]|nr:patatin-like phospholipase family protein [Trueperaceae bacterium]
MKRSDPTIGVALGGGSARGYAHIGALAALERHGLAPQVVAGTSFGAVVGALYAMRRTPAQMEAQAAALRRRDVLPRVIDFGLFEAALFSGQRLEAYFDRLVEGRAFEDLDRTLVVVATDADTGERVALREGPLAPALRASASMPGVFAPVEHQGRRLIDGGIGTPVPVRSLDAFALDLKIGIGAGTDADDSGAIRWVVRAMEHPWGQGVHRALGRGGTGRLGSLARAVAWTMDGYADAPMTGASPAVEDVSDMEVHTRPPIHWLRFDRAEDAIRAGESALDAAAPRLLAALRDAVARGGPRAGAVTVVPAG